MATVLLLDSIGCSLFVLNVDFHVLLRCQRGSDLSSSSLRRFWAWASRHTSLISATRLQPFLRSKLQLPLQLGARLLPMNEVAEASSHAALTTVQATARLPEVCDRAQLAVYRPGG